MLSPHFQRVFEHMSWADGRVLDAILQAGGAAEAALQLYAHVLAAEHVWLSRIRGTAAQVSVWPKLSADSCAVLARDNAAEFTLLWNELQQNPSRAEDRIAYRNSAGEEFTNRLEDILLHVALHGSYHRGQVALLLRNAGATPAPTDYIAFIRGAPAATHQPFADTARSR